MSSSHVAADDNVTTKDGLHADTLVDEVRDDTSGHRELNGSSVDNTDNVSGAGSRQMAEERSVHAVLGVKLNNLLVVIGALEELNPGIEGTAIGPKKDLNAIDRRVERISAESTTLNSRGGSDAVLRRLIDSVCDDVGGEREFNLSDVSNGDGVRATRRLNYGTKWTNLAIFDVDSHFDRSVVRSMPQFDVGVERTALSAENNLDLLDSGRAVGPGAESATLNEDGSVLFDRSAGATGQPAGLSGNLAWSRHGIAQVLRGLHLRRLNNRHLLGAHNWCRGKAGCRHKHTCVPIG